MPSNVEIGILVSAKNQASNVLSSVDDQIQSLKKNVQSFGENFVNLGKQMQKVGAGLSAGVTAPLLGAGAAALHAATNFNAAMANVATLDVPTERIEELKISVRELAVEVGKSTEDLAGGLYQTISAFGDSADTVEILRINAKAAAAGLATTTDAINLTSAVTKAYGDTSSEAVQKVADLAFQAVKLGQTTFPELAGSLGRVSPLAAALGVSLEELFGVMATFTGVTGTASEVSTQLRGVLQALMAPTNSMIELMDSLGFSSGEAMLKQLGLQGTIEAIVQAAEESGTPLQKFIGSIEGQTLALAASGGQAETFTQKLAAMKEAAGAADAAFSAQTEGVNQLGFKWQQLQQQLETFSQRIGDALVPGATQLLGSLEPLIGVIDRMISGFESLDPSTQATLLGIAGAAALLGPALLAVGTAMTLVVPAVAGLATALGVLVSPIGAVIAASAALGAAWTFNWFNIRETTSSALDSIRENLASAGEQLGNLLEPAIQRTQAVFQQLPSQLEPLREAFGSLLTTLGEALAPLQPILENIGQMFLDAFGVVAISAINLFSSTLGAVIPAIVIILEQLIVMIELVSTTISNMVTLVIALLTGDWETAFTSAQAIGEAFATAFQSTMENLAELVNVVMLAISSAVVNTLTDLGVDVPALLNQLTAVWDSTWSGMTGAINVVKGGIDSFRSALEGFVSWVGGISIPNPFAGWQFPELPSLPGFGTRNAIGSLSFAGGIAMVGETGPELVMLPTGSRIFGAQETAAIAGSGGISINVQNMVVREEKDIYVLAYEVARLLRR